MRTRNGYIFIFKCIVYHQPFPYDVNYNISGSGVSSQLSYEGTPNSENKCSINNVILTFRKLQKKSHTITNEI